MRSLNVNNNYIEFKEFMSYNEWRRGGCHNYREIGGLYNVSFSNRDA